MGQNKVFLDTNVLLDYVLDRGEASVMVERIFEKCVQGEIECHIATHSVINMFYILRKQYSVRARKMILASLCDLCYVETIDEEKIRNVLAGVHNDIENHLQMLCAEAAGADFIVTRDIRGFKDSPIKALTPGDYLSKQL